MKILETERLLLRKFQESDWKDLYEYLSKESVVKYEPYNALTEDECKQEALYRSKEDAFWAVCLKDNKKLIGNVYFQKQELEEFLTWEIGYVFNPMYYGNGYATESCRAILNYGFEELKARRIIAMCNPENTASWRVLQRLNMRREGHLLKNIFFKYDENKNPIWNDTYEYAMLKDEWVNLAK